MNTFEQAGEAMLLAHEGQIILGRALVSTVKEWMAGLKTWLGNMPTTLPPTESPHR